MIAGRDILDARSYADRRRRRRALLDAFAREAWALLVIVAFAAVLLVAIELLGCGPSLAEIEAGTARARDCTAAYERATTLDEVKAVEAVCERDGGAP